MTLESAGLVQRQQYGPYTLTLKLDHNRFVTAELRRGMERQELVAELRRIADRVEAMR